MYVSSERIFNTRSKEKKLFIALYSAQLSLRGHASYPCIVLPVKMVTFRAERDKKQGWHIFLKPFKIGFQKNETRCFVRSTAPLWPAPHTIVVLLGTHTPSDDLVPSPHRSIVPLTHPKESGHRVHTRSDVGMHPRTSTWPSGQKPGVHCVQAVEDAADHETPLTHGIWVVLLGHSIPSLHGQQILGCPVSVQLRNRNSPGLHAQSITSAVVSSMMCRNHGVYLHA